MSAWEYKVVPAPTKGVKARGIKGPEARFAYALEILMNDMGAEGWEFQRAETLPSTERAGLTGTTTEWRNMMVFRRACAEEAEEFERELLPAPVPTVEAEPEPDMDASTVQKREEHDMPRVISHSADGADEFEHARSTVAPKSPGPSGGETKSPI